MNAHLPIQAPPPFNPAMFRWARERRELSVEEAAARVAVRPEAVLAWERGETVPTVRQARKLAGYYDRSFLEFFRDGPPAPLPNPCSSPTFACIEARRGLMRAAT